MDHARHVRRHLQALEQVLQKHNLWQPVITDPRALESTQPFCMDTLEPHEWLQWVLIPRMHALLDSHSPLPTAFALAPYYEMALDSTRQEKADLMAVLLALDMLFVAETD